MNCILNFGSNMVVIDINEYLKKFFEAEEISEHNQKVITRYYNYLKLDNAKPTTVINNLEVMRFIAIQLKNYNLDEITEDELFIFNDALESWEYLRNGKVCKFANATKIQYKIAMRRFLIGYGTRQKKPELVELGKTISVKGMPGAPMKKPSDMLKLEEVKKLIDSTQTLRDAAILAMLYESGCRIGELANCKIKDIEFDEHGCVVHLNGKTGERLVQLVFAASYIRNWINAHPLKDNRDSSLWVSNIRFAKTKGAELKYHQLDKKGISGMINRIAKIANITKEDGSLKRITPHIFRHSRVTHLSTQFTEAEQRLYFGWSHKSDMPSRYSHLSHTDLRNSVLKLYGFSETQNLNMIDMKACPRCKQPTEANDSYCSLCGLPLTKEVEQNNEVAFNDMLTFLAQNKDLLNEVLAKARN